MMRLVRSITYNQLTSIMETINVGCLLIPMVFEGNAFSPITDY